MDISFDIKRIEYCIERDKKQWILSIGKNSYIAETLLKALKDAIKNKVFGISLL